MAGECVEARPKRLRSNICRCCPRDPKHANQHPPVRRHTKSAKDTGYNLCFSSTSCVNYEGQQGTRPRTARRAGDEAAGSASSKQREQGGKDPTALETQTQVGPIQMDGTHLYISREPIPREFLFLGASVTSETLLPHALEPKLEVEANGTLTPADVDASRPHQEQGREHPDRSPEQHSHQCAQDSSSEEPSCSHLAREQSLTQKEKAQSWEE